MKTYQLTKRLGLFPEGYTFREDEAKYDADKKVFVLSTPGNIVGPNTVEFPEAIVEEKQ